MDIRETTFFSVITISYIIITWTRNFHKTSKWIKYTMGTIGIIYSLWALAARIMIELGFVAIDKFLTPRG